MYKPTLAEVENLAGSGNLIPIYRELPADMETPVSVYLKLQDEGPSFLLESITGGKVIARYSFIGVRPSATLTVSGDKMIFSADGSERSIALTDGKDPLSVLKDEMARYKLIPVAGLPRFSGGGIGYISYDTVRRFETLPTSAKDEVLDLPEAAFMLADTLVAFDHVCQRLLIIANARLEGSNIQAAYRRATARIDEIVARLKAPIPEAYARIPGETPANNGSSLRFTSNFSQPQFEALVERAKEYIRAGDIFQVVLSQRLTGKSKAQPFNIYRSLRQINPSPYMVFMRFPGGFNSSPLHIISASPEMHARLENGIAELCPIAGTRPRGSTPAEDEALAEDLLNDEKERAEHVMLVDLGRNDLGRVCEYGSVRVEKMMSIENFSHVMHIVTSIRGQLQAGRDAFDLLRATFPAGTVSGAPKVRAMEIIEELEATRRGIYAGAIGYVGYDGNMDSCIAIRTIVQHGENITVQVGAGIVADSDPAREHEEIYNKGRALREAILAAEKEA